MLDQSECPMCGAYLDCDYSIRNHQYAFCSMTCQNEYEQLINEEKELKRQAIINQIAAKATVEEIAQTSSGLTSSSATFKKRRLLRWADDDNHHRRYLSYLEPCSTFARKEDCAEKTRIFLSLFK